MNQLFLVMKVIMTPPSRGSASTWMSAYLPVAKRRSMLVRTTDIRRGCFSFSGRISNNSEGSNGCSCRSEEHTSELLSLCVISYAVFCLKKKNKHSKQAINPRQRNNKKTNITPKTT